MIFLNSASSAAALVFYLPGVCTHNDTEGKQRKAWVRNILKSSKKNTIFNEHHVCKYNKACQNECKQRWQGISAILSYVLSNDISMLHTGSSRKKAFLTRRILKYCLPPPPLVSATSYRQKVTSQMPKDVLLYLFSTSFRSLAFF